MSLNAITAELPAYLMPPKSEEGGQKTKTPETEFGPSSQVDISEQKDVDAQSQQPGTSGLYGPDGRFVETAARRDLEHGAAEKGRQQPASTPDASTEVAPERSTSVSTSEVPRNETGENTLNPDKSEEPRQRNLPFPGSESVVPPATRGELAALADRIERGSAARNPEPSELKQIAQLMQQAGRYSAADDASRKAKELEQASQPGPKENAPTVLAGPDEVRESEVGDVGKPEQGSPEEEDAPNVLDGLVQ